MKTRYALLTQYVISYVVDSHVEQYATDEIKGMHHDHESTALYYEYGVYDSEEEALRQAREILKPGERFFIQKVYEITQVESKEADCE